MTAIAGKINPGKLRPLAGVFDYEIYTLFYSITTAA
jgi:hypothetical protein